MAALFSLAAVVLGFFHSLALLVSSLIFLSLSDTGLMKIMGSAGLALAKARILLRVDVDIIRWFFWLLKGF
jgi:hypothetical protein